jgi:hypothetical protein
MDVDRPSEGSQSNHRRDADELGSRQGINLRSCLSLVPTLVHYACSVHTHSRLLPGYDKCKLLLASRQLYIRVYVVSISRVYVRNDR